MWVGLTVVKGRVKSSCVEKKQQSAEAAPKLLIQRFGVIPQSDTCYILCTTQEQAAFIYD